MSKRIDHDHPYSDEEKAYLLKLANGEDLIALNERRFGHLDEEKKADLQARSQEDEQKELEIQKALEEQAKQEEEDSYHPDDVEFVDPLTVAQLRTELEERGLESSVTKEDEGEGEDHLTEKQVLVYRLLNHLDEKRKSAK